MKYIPSDKLIAEIERLSAEHSSRYGMDEAAIVLDKLEDFISSLQQEQPEVDLEKEIDKWFKIVRDDDGCAHIVSLNGSKCDDWKKENYVLNKLSFIDIALHFYELGLNARKK